MAQVGAAAAGDGFRWEPSESRAARLNSAIDVCFNFAEASERIEKIEETHCRAAVGPFWTHGDALP